MHHVDAEIAGAGDSRERVHIGAVHVEQSAARVQQFGNLGDARLERSERRRIRHHQRGDVFGDQRLEMLQIHLPARVRADVFDFVAGNHRGGGIGSVRRIGNQNFFASVAAARETCANQQQPGQLALGSGGGLHGDGVHARDFEQALLQRGENFEAALRQLLRLERVLGGQAVEPRDEFVYARVVLHGARSQRIHPQVDGVIPGGKPRKVAEHFDLADLGHSFNAVARVLGAQHALRIHRRHVQRRQLDAALSRSRFLEDQPLVLAGMAARFFDPVGQVISSKPASPVCVSRQPRSARFPPAV